LIHIALEGRCFVLSACQYATKSHFPESHAAQAHDSIVIISGGSIIVSPSGQILAGPLRDAEGECSVSELRWRAYDLLSGVLTAEIDLDDIIRGKFDLDVSEGGHYALSHIFASGLKTKA